MRLCWTILCIFLAVPTMAQHRPLPKATAILLGRNMNFDEEHYSMAAMVVERTLLQHASMQIGLGINCLSSPHNPTYRRFDTELFTELRYYFMLRRGHTLSGFYAGFFADANRLRWIYRAENQTAIRKSYFDLGPSAGYQHAIGRYIRFNLGLMAGYNPTANEIHFAPNGSIDYVDADWTPWVALWYVRLGVVF